MLTTRALASKIPVERGIATGERDVIPVLYSQSWAAAVASRFTIGEARLAAALPDHPRVGRVLK